MSKMTSRLDMQAAPTLARGHVSDEITRLRVACLGIVSRPGQLRHVSDLSPDCGSRCVSPGRHETQQHASLPANGATPNESGALRQRRVDDALPRKWGRASRTPSPACGGRLGWGRNRAHVTWEFAPTPTLTHLWGREWGLVRADKVIR